MILEVDGSFYETYRRAQCSGCFFKGERCTMPYREIECSDEEGHPAIWKPMSKETLQRIISRLR
jgi:hypothetical protein